MNLFETVTEAEFEQAEDSDTCLQHGKIPEQRGPLRHYDTEARCASRGCNSPTHFKLEGVSYCMIHCLYLMNEMLT